MKPAYKLFQQMKPETALAIVQYLRDEQREVYKATIRSIATNRKLRPIIIQRKPASDQIDWILKNVRMRGSAEVATQMLQLWLLKAHTSLLNRFLDGLGVEHDETGAAEDLPDTLDPEKLEKTVKELLGDTDPEVVRIYLHIFQGQKSGGWSALTDLIEKTPELQFAAEAETEPA